MRLLMHLWNFIAAALWMLFLWKRLRYIADKQDGGTLAMFFLAGCMSVMVTAVLHGIYPLPFIVPFIYDTNLAYQVLVTGVIEETAKFLCFLSVAHALGTTKEPQDGVIQGAVVGLAFGMVENILYIDRYMSLFMFVRPILTTGAHAIFGAIWGGYYSAAVYSNIHSKDRASYRMAIGGVALVAVIHGLYNATVVFSLFIGIAVNLIALTIAIRLFLNLVDHSPYRLFPFSQAEAAIANIRRGLHFNPKSVILNRNIGLYLMYAGKYRAAASHLAKSIPRAYDPRRARFFVAVCELSFVPEAHSMRMMRRAWARLSDDQRRKLLDQLEQLLETNPALIEQVHDFIDRAFKPRNWKPAHELARELRVRKAERKSRGAARSPVYDELLSKMSRQEIRELAARVG